MEIKLPSTRDSIYHLADVLSEISLKDLEGYNASAQHYPKTREAARYRHMLLFEAQYARGNFNNGLKPRWMSNEVWSNLAMLRAMVFSPDVLVTAEKLSQENKDFVECMKIARSFYPGVSRQVLACGNERCSSGLVRISASACASHFRAINARLPIPSDMYRPAVRTRLPADIPWGNLPCPNRYCASKDHIQIEAKLQESKLPTRVAAQSIVLKPREMSLFLPSEVTDWWINISAVERDQLIKNGATDILTRYSLEYNAFFGTGDGDYGIIDLFQLHWSDYTDRLQMSNKIRSFVGQLEILAQNFDESVPFSKLVPDNQDLSLIGMYADDMAENNKWFDTMRNGKTTLAQWREFMVNRIDKLRENRTFDHRAACQLIVDRYIAELVDVIQLAREQYPTSSQYVSSVCQLLILGLQKWKNGSQPVEALIARYCGRHDIELILMNGQTSLQNLNSVHAGEDDAMMQIMRAFKAKGPYTILPSFESTVIGRFNFAGVSVDFDNDIEQLRKRSRTLVETFKLLGGTPSAGVRKANDALSEAEDDLGQIPARSTKVSRNMESPRSIGYAQNSPSAKKRSSDSPMSIGYREKTPSLEYPETGPTRDRDKYHDDAESDSDVHPSIRGDNDADEPTESIPVINEQKTVPTTDQPVAMVSSQSPVNLKPVAVAAADLDRRRDVIDLTSDRPAVFMSRPPDRVLITNEEQMELVEMALERIKQEQATKTKKGRPKGTKKTPESTEVVPVETKKATRGRPRKAKKITESTEAEPNENQLKRKPKTESVPESTAAAIVEVPFEPVYDDADLPLEPVDQSEDNQMGFGGTQLDTRASTMAMSNNVTRESSGTPIKQSRNTVTPQAITSRNGAKSAPASPRSVVNAPVSVSSAPVVGNTTILPAAPVTLAAPVAERNPLSAMTSGRSVQMTEQMLPTAASRSKQSSRMTNRSAGTPASSKTTPSSATSSAVSASNMTAHVDEMLQDLATEFPVFRQFLRDTLLRASFLQTQSPRQILENVTKLQTQLAKNQKVVDEARVAYFKAIGTNGDFSKEETVLKRFAVELAPVLSDFAYWQLQLNLLRYDLADQQLANSKYVRQCDVNADTVLADMKHRGDYDLTAFNLGYYVKGMAALFEDQMRGYESLIQSDSDDIEHETISLMRRLAPEKHRIDAKSYASVGRNVTISYMLQDDKTLKNRMRDCAAQSKSMIDLMELDDDEIYAAMMTSLAKYMYLQSPAVTTTVRELPDALKVHMANRMTVSVVKSVAASPPKVVQSKVAVTSEQADDDDGDAEDKSSNEQEDASGQEDEEIEDAPESDEGDDESDSDDEEWSEGSEQDEQSPVERKSAARKLNAAKGSKAAAKPQNRRTLRSDVPQVESKKEPVESDRASRFKARQGMQPAEVYLNNTKPVESTAVQLTVAGKNKGKLSTLNNLPDSVLKQLFLLMYERALILQASNNPEKVKRIGELRLQLQQEQANLDKTRAAYLVAQKSRGPEKGTKLQELTALSQRLAPVVDEFAKLQLELNLLRYDLLDQQMTAGFIQSYSVTPQSLLEDFSRNADYDLLRFHFQSYLSVMLAMFTREWKARTGQIDRFRGSRDQLENENYIVTTFLVQSYLDKEHVDKKIWNNLSASATLVDVSANEALMKRLMKIHTNELQQLKQQLERTPDQLYAWMWENYRGMIYSPQPAEVVDARPVPQILMSAGLRTTLQKSGRMQDFGEEDEDDGWVSYSEEDTIDQYPPVRIKSDEPMTQEELDELENIRSILAPAEVKPKDAVNANLYRRKKVRLGPDGKRLPTDKMKPLAPGEVTNYDYYYAKLMDFNYNPPEDKLTPAYVYAVNRLASEVQDEFGIERLSENNLKDPKQMQANLSMYIALYRAHQAGQGRIRATKLASVASLTSLDDEEVKTARSKEPEFVGAIPPGQFTAEQTRLYSLLDRVLDMQPFADIAAKYSDDAVYHGHNRVAELIEKSPSNQLIADANQEKITSLVEKYAKEYHDELNS